LNSPKYDNCTVTSFDVALYATDNILILSLLNNIKSVNAVELGADLEATTDGGWTALQCAVEERHQVVSMLLDNGAESNTAGDDGGTPLHMAALAGPCSIVRLLLEKGASVDAKTDDDRTPLHYAAMGGYCGIARLLLVSGANPKAKNARGQVPLQTAAEHDHLAVLRLLINWTDPKTKQRASRELTPADGAMTASRR